VGTPVGELEGETVALPGCTVGLGVDLAVGSGVGALVGMSVDR
jgi:hypothetical protein